MSELRPVAAVTRDIVFRKTDTIDAIIQAERDAVVRECVNVVYAAKLQLQHWESLESAILAVAKPAESERERLGRVVREAWIKWADSQEFPKPSWMVPWGELDKVDREADMQIGGAVRAELAKIQEETE